ncbi:hypothetical protein ACQ4PT_046495 [Festuca glaucescens]
MWRKGNKRFGGGGSGGDPPAKRQAAGKDDADDGGTVVAQISKNKRVSVRSWNGKVMVDVREFYVKDGKDLPGRKGIAVTLSTSWKILRDNIKAIDEAIKENT